MTDNRAETARLNCLEFASHDQYNAVLFVNRLCCHD